MFKKCFSTDAVECELLNKYYANFESEQKDDLYYQTFFIKKKESFSNHLCNDNNIFLSNLCFKFHSNIKYRISYNHKKYIKGKKASPTDGRADPYYFKNVQY